MTSRRAMEMCGMAANRESSEWDRIVYRVTRWGPRAEDEFDEDFVWEVQLRFLDEHDRLVRVELLDFYDIGDPQPISIVRQFVARVNDNGESMIRRFDKSAR